MICASKFNETRTSTSQSAIAITLPIVAGRIALARGLIIIGVVFFIYCHHRKEKLKLKEEADHTYVEFDTDTQPQCKSHCHPANHDLSNSQRAVSFRRTVSEFLYTPEIYFFIRNLLIQMTTPSVLHLLKEFVLL